VKKQLELQALGRVHRLGQRREVTIYRLACLDTIEARILQMHASGEVVSSSNGLVEQDDNVALSESRYRKLLGMLSSEKKKRQQETMTMQLPHREDLDSSDDGYVKGEEWMEEEEEEEPSQQSDSEIKAVVKIERNGATNRDRFG